MHSAVVLGRVEVPVELSEEQAISLESALPVDHLIEHFANQLDVINTIYNSVIAGAKSLPVS